MNDKQTFSHSTVVEKNLHASAERIFNAWLNADSLQEWMKPGTGMGSKVLELTPEVGGHFKIEMFDNDNATYMHTGEYLEITPYSRIVFTWCSPATLQHPSIVTIELTEKGDMTNLVLTHTELPDQQQADNHNAGWGHIIDTLNQHMS